jgi:hypothetical protein
MRRPLPTTVESAKSETRGSQGGEARLRKEQEPARHRVIQVRNHYAQGLGGEFFSLKRICPSAAQGHRHPRRERTGRPARRPGGTVDKL